MTKDNFFDCFYSIPSDYLEKFFEIASKGSLIKLFEFKKSN